jgi:hypothetical protein
MTHYVIIYIRLYLEGEPKMCQNFVPFKNYRSTDEHQEAVRYGTFHLCFSKQRHTKKYGK